MEPREDTTKGEGLYKAIMKRFEDARGPNGKIHTEEIAIAAAGMAPIYDIVFGSGMVSNHLKKDIMNSSGAVKNAWEQNPEQCNTIDMLIIFEKEHATIEKIRKDSKSGVKNLLWMNRALDFMITFLHGVFVKNVDKPAKFSANEAYNAILKPYHGLLVSGIVTLAFNLCPSRDELIRKLGFINDKVEEKVIHLHSIIKPMCETTIKLLEDEGCNFKDKA